MSCDTIPKEIQVQIKPRKALDYYNEYVGRLCPPLQKGLSKEEISDIVWEPVCNLLDAFNAESILLCDIRHTSANASIVSILKEQNQKWNALRRLLIKKQGFCVLQDDGFKNYWLIKMPEMKGEWK